MPDAAADWARLWGIAVRVQIRWSDLDSLGHLNQGAYHVYLEEARSQMFESRTGADAEGYVLARIELDHLGEITSGEGEVVVGLCVAHVGTTSIRVEHEIRAPDGRIVARGNSVLVAWDQEARKKRGIEDGERARLLELTARPDPA